MKRKERRHLKADEFASTLQKTYDFLKKRKKAFLSLAAGAAVLLLLFAGFKYTQGRAAGKEDAALSRALELRESLKTDTDKIVDLERMSEKGRASRLALLLLAGYWMEKADSDRAETYLLKIKGSPRDLVYYQAQDLLSQIYFQRKNYDRVIEITRAVQSENPRDYVLDPILFRQAEALERKGLKSEALTLYKKLQEEYSTTYYGYEAGEKVRDLESRQ